MSQPTASFDSSVLATFPATFSLLKEKGILTPTIALDAFKASLDPEQQRIVTQILELNPQDYGVKTPFVGVLEPVPDDLVRVSGQNFTDHGKQAILDDKYVPRHIFEAYSRMNKKFTTDHSDRTLLIGACYRSPAYQIVVFINWLINGYGGDIGKTIRHASPPTYSQHTVASKAAIDFKTIDGSPSDDHPEDFKDTTEYAWLRQHASEFDFYESWLEGTEFGMRAKPWHWQYRGKPK
jgi:hypothetical protein